MERPRIYRKLQQHLDKQVTRFPQYKSGADISLLMCVFSPEQAELAVNLTYKFESAKQIYERVKDIVGSAEDLEHKLDEIVMKGGIGYTEKEGVSHYRNIPLSNGIFEHNLDRLTPEFVNAFNEFKKDMFGWGLSVLGTKVDQVRTIPIEKSLTPEHHVANYDQLEHLIKSTNNPIVVSECICRQHKKVEGQPCKTTTRDEVCLSFEHTAKCFIKQNLGRQVSKEEALEISRQNQKEGLVLNTGNSQEIEFVCGCCGCCCLAITGISQMPRPAQFYTHNYYATVDPDLCVGCGKCVDVCVMKANKLGDKNKTSEVNLYRCIGCGNCITRCPQKARKLKKKKKETIPPKTDEDLYDIIMANRKGKFGSFLRIMKRYLKNPKK